MAIVNKRTKTEKIVNGLIVAFLLFLCITTIFPFLNLIAKSLSGESAVIRGDIFLLPKNLQFGTYRYVMREPQFSQSFKNSLFVTIVGTALAMLCNCLTAYPLSKPWLLGRKFIIYFFVFTMLFSGGMVPSYLLMNQLKLLNNIWVLILPGLLSVYNTILLKNFFEEIPESIEESALIDGASRIKILFRIVLPISLPALATIGLFYTVGFWNNYMSGVLYITRPSLKPLQQYLFEVVTEAQNVGQQVSQGATVSQDVLMDASLNSESIRAVTIMLASLPIMLVYPFLQKYFVRGLRVGSVKG